MSSGELSGSSLEDLKALVADLYLPIVQEQAGWGKVTPEHTTDFVGATLKFGAMLSEAVATVSGGVELRKPDTKYTDHHELKPSAFAAAAADEDCLRALEDCLQEWCSETEGLLAQTHKIKEGEEPGPDTELEYWRSRMSNLNSITEQLKAKEARLVLGVCGHAKSKGSARWKALDIQASLCFLSSEDRQHAATSEGTLTIKEVKNEIRMK